MASESGRTDPQATEQALREQQEWLRVALSSIGDAVITTDTKGNVTFLNPVAKSLTGWKSEDAAGKPLDTVFKLINEGTRQLVENPASRALRKGVVVGLANHNLLIAKDGTERPIDDRAAPIRNDKGELAGVVLVFRDISKRRGHEQAMQKALAYADDIIATLREPFVVLNSDLRVKTANRAFYDSFHVTKEESENRLVYELGNGQWDIPGLRKLLVKVLSQNRPVHDFQVEHDFPALGRKTMLLNARGFPPDAKCPEFILLAMEDITHRREAEFAVKDSEVRYRRLFETAKDGILILHAETGKVIDANPFMTALLGYSHDEFVGKELWEIGLFRDIEESRAAYVELQEKGYVRYENLPLETSGRQAVDVEFVSNVYAENDQQVAQCNIRDITERSRLERQLHDSEARFRGIFEQTMAGIAETDLTGQLTKVNGRFCEIAGRPANELYGLRMQDITHPDDRPRNLALFESLTKGGPPFVIEKRYIRPDGSHVWVSNSVSLVSDENRNPIAAVAVILDITEHIQLEQQAQQQSETLADLHRRKDEFLAMLSHELRNPLAAICNAAHLLRIQKEENTPQKQARTIIERQTAQLGRLVDDLLEISRITTGRVQLRLERVAVSGIVERAVEAVRPLMEKQRHELRISLPPETIWLHADPARLEQVVGNLLTNAAKYTGKGGQIWLTVQQEGDDCVLRVRDTGVGIAPDLLPRIFDLFTQAERSLDRSQGGLGIGLALVQRLVEMHQGRVEAYSALGQGSEFVVRLPVVLSSELPSPLPTTEKVQPTGRSLRVLVVEDNTDTALGLELLLHAFGHQVRAVHDGLTAVQAAVDYRPNLVLLDIGLPGLNGFEVAQRMREQPGLDNIVLVAVTGYGKETDHQRSREAGFDYHLVKPVDFKTVEQILATVSEKAT